MASKRFFRYLVSVFVFVLSASAPAWPAQAARVQSDLALVVLLSGADIDEIIEHVELAGGSVTHVFADSAFIGRVPTRTALLEGVLAVHRQVIDTSTMMDWPDGAQRAAQVWNVLSTPTAASAGASLQGLEAELVDDVLEAPLPVESQSSSDPIPGYTQTSEYMIGRVAVGIVLPESDGSIDVSFEDWTGDERALALSEIVSALDWWAAREPNANLTFVYDDGTAAPIPTSYEPIIHSISSQHLWISEVMENKGYSGLSYFDQVRQYNNALRDRYDTDWAFTILCVDSSADQDNRFADSYFAYAYRYGPFMVITYGNNGYGPNNMDAVVAHEVGHIFGALDQYVGAKQECTQQSGYLGVENQNSMYGSCESDVDSIMRGQVWPYMYEAVDDYARGQIGWRDSDGDGILDPVDTPYRVTSASYVAHATLPNVLTFTGNVQGDPYPSPLRSSVTINRIAGVQYRVNGEPWIDAQAVDGVFDSYAEDFAFTTWPLPTGDSAFELRVVDSAGNELIRPLAEVPVTDPIDDILNTTLARLDSAQDEGEAAHSDGARRLVYEGQASSNTSFVAEVHYRLDNGLWQDVSAADGAFDESSESFSFAIDLAGLAVGQHVVEAYSVDGQQHIETSPARDIFSIEQQTFTIFLPIVIK
ncbi:MAG: hypothetical protein JXA89_02465 [Anaerolineae bacterium]|nr:hypothetical protein [Anaerolineae bacterium]